MSDLQKQAFGEELTSNLSLAEVWLSGELQSLVEGDGEETGIKGEINAALETVTDTFNTATAKLPKITEIKDTTTQITTSATEAISTNITNAFDKVQAAISNLKTKIANGKVAGAGGTGPTDKSAQEAAISAQKASAQKAVNTQKAISALGSGGSIEDAWNQYENLSAEEKELLSQEDINKLDEYHKAYERIEKTTMEVKSGFNWSEARKEEEWGLIKNGEGRELEVAVDGSQGLNNDHAKQAVKAGVKDGEIFQDKNAEKPAWYILDIPSSNPNEPNALQILKDWVSDRSGYNWWKFHPAHFSKFNGTDSTYQKTTYNELINNENLKGMKYKSGGYADYTGFAWLDGTPSHPEAVLNASDTERFIALIDTLRSLEADGAGSSGDNYFDINIEVGSVSGDYDVERMADKIKEIIVNDAAYRNVNSINLIQ